MIGKTLYADYIKARQGLELLETNSCFLTYKIDGEECFIANAYTKPSARGNREMGGLISRLEVLVKEQGAKYTTAIIDLADGQASKTLLASLKAGFSLLRNNGNTIIIIKYINEVNNG